MAMTRLENASERDKQTGMWHDFNTYNSKVIRKLSSMASQVAKAVFGSSVWMSGSAFKPEAWRYQKCAGSDLWSQYQFVQKCTTNLPFQSLSLATPAAKKTHTGPEREATTAAAIWFQHSHSNIWMQKGCCGPPGPRSTLLDHLRASWCKDCAAARMGWLTGWLEATKSSSGSKSSSLSVNSSSSPSISTSASAASKPSYVTSGWGGGGRGGGGGASGEKEGQS